jgi:hypothetical protein
VNRLHSIKSCLGDFLLLAIAYALLLSSSVLSYREKPIA